jgi:hypothetical protein
MASSRVADASSLMLVFSGLRKPLVKMSIWWHSMRPMQRGDEGQEFGLVICHGHLALELDQLPEHVAAEGWTESLAH